MPVNNGEYEKLSADEIQQRFKETLEDELDTTAQPGDLVTKQLRAEAETLAKNQEEALDRVYRAAYLQDATGKELDKLVDIIGITRLEPTSATGVAKFWRETPPTSTYTIPRGITIQTSGSITKEFDTTQKGTLEYIDGFEANDFNNWTDDVGSFDIIESGAIDGSRSLEIPATSDVQIRTTQSDFRVGTTFTLNANMAAGAVKGFRFGYQDPSNYFECILDENAQELSLRLIEEDSESALSTESSATIPSNQTFYVEIRWGLYKDSKVALYESDNRDTELCSTSLSQTPQWSIGDFAIFSSGNNATGLIDEVSTRIVHVNIEAKEADGKQNLAPNTLTTMKSSISGVEAVTNPVPTGSLNDKDTNFAPMIVGDDGETDEELRERAFNNTSIGGSATVNALKTRIREVEGVKAITLNRNRTENTVDGMPPHSFEAVVYGGTDEEVAEAIFNTASIDSHDVGGINGTEVNYNINSSVTKDTELISFSRPNRLNLDITVDLVIDDNYVGETEIRSIITEHVGGKDINGNFVTGLDVGENLYVSLFKQELVAPKDTGVWEVDSVTIDKSGDGTDDTTEEASGADILAVGDSEVAVTNARDDSITINTTQK